MSFGELAGSQNIADSVNVRICHFLQSSLKIPSPTKNHGQNAVLHSIYAANQLLRAILAKRESGELLPHPLEFHQRVEHEPFFLPDPLCVFFLGNYLQIIPRLLFEYWNNYGTMGGSARASGNTHWGDWSGNSQAPMDHWSVEDWFCFLRPVMEKKTLCLRQIGKNKKLDTLHLPW